MAIVSLRPFALSDVTDQYVKWMQDPEVIRFILYSHQTILSLVEYVRSILSDPEQSFYAIIVNEHHIGNIKVDRGEVGILIGEKDYWGKGYGTEAIRLVGGRTAGVNPKNIGSLLAFQRAGWVVVGMRGTDILLENRIA